VAAAALAIPDLAALIFSAYCSGIRVDFHPLRLSNSREINIERSQILGGANASRMSAYPAYRSRRHPDPLRCALENRSDASRI
jgi:hypothetical protein